MLCSGQERCCNYVCDSSGEKVPVWKKLAYAVGSMPYSMITVVIGFYFNIFLLEAVIVSCGTQQGVTYSIVTMHATFYIIYSWTLCTCWLLYSLGGYGMPSVTLL